MTWTYNPTLLEDSVVGKLMQTRRWLGDVTVTDPQFQDEEIKFLLDQNPDPLRAAISGARMLSAQFARQIDYKHPDLTESLSQRATAYRALADDLQEQLGRDPVTPYAGGLSLAERQRHSLDMDLPQPNFRIADAAIIKTG